MSIVVLNSATKSYKEISLLSVFKPKFHTGVTELSFEINKGETFGLLGLNGAGKTTTIKLILGLINPDSGSVKIFEEPIKNRKILKKIGYLPEISYLFKNLTVYETLNFLSKLSGQDVSKSKIEETLEFVGLSNVLSKRVAKFSKGMMQRLAIAQTLIHDPELLVFDEPTSGLDPLGIKEMRLMLESLKEKGKTIILSSHHISEVEKLCDRVCILVNGTAKKIVGNSQFSMPGELEKIFIETVIC